MAFRVGQKVVCIHPVNNFRENEIYTVMGIDAVYLHIDSLIGNRPIVGFFSWRFRPVVERKTDISIFTKMLTLATRQVETV